MIEIRIALPDDAEALARLNRKGMGYDFPVEKTKENLIEALKKDYEVIFVAICEEKIVGYAHACDYCLLFADKYANLLGISVDEAFTRKGVGSKLMQAVEYWAKSRNACGVRLVSGESRVGAHEFYEKCGYTTTKKQKNFKKIF